MRNIVRGSPSAGRRLRPRKRVARAGGARTGPREPRRDRASSTKVAEEAVYFARSEAIQNVAKYAARSAQVTLRMRYDQGSLAVASQTMVVGSILLSPRKGLAENIRDRIEVLGGTFKVASSPGRGPC